MIDESSLKMAAVMINASTFQKQHVPIILCSIQMEIRTNRILWEIQFILWKKVADFSTFYRCLQWIFMKSFLLLIWFNVNHPGQLMNKLWNTIKKIQFSSVLLFMALVSFNNFKYLLAKSKCMAVTTLQHVLCVPFGIECCF